MTEKEFITKYESIISSHMLTVLLFCTGMLFIFVAILQSKPNFVCVGLGSVSIIAAWLLGNHASKQSQDFLSELFPLSRGGKEENNVVLEE